MKRLAFPFAVLIAVSLAACTSGPKISAAEMKHQLEMNVYEFNQDLNSADIEAAKSFVAPQAEKAFQELIAGYSGGKYNMFTTDDVPEIDYIGGKSYVKMNLFFGKNTGTAGAKQVGSQNHLWTYSNGGWLWAGPVAR